MANSNGWGDGSVNNNIGWGQGANNAIGWGDIHADSWAGLTDIVGVAPSTPLLLDTYEGATVAYSLRKLRTAYTGSAIRVRRSVDNAEQDIAFSGNDLDTTTMLDFVGYNLWTYSEEFNNALYVKTNINTTGTPAYIDVETAPNSTLTADKIIENTTSGSHFFRRVSGTIVNGIDYNISVFLKQGERTKVEITSNISGANQTCILDLTNGSISSNGFANTPIVTAESNGWYRFSVTITSGTTSATSAISVTLSNGTTISYTGDGTSGAYVWGTQLSQTSSVKTYQKTVATAGGAGFIATWYDQSTNANNSTNATPTQQAQVVSNGNLVLDPNNNKLSSQWTNDQYIMADIVNINQKFLFTEVVNRAATNNSVLPTGNLSANFYIVRWTSTGNIETILGSGAATVTHATGDTATGNYIISALRDGSNVVKAWKNGSALSTGTSVGTTPPWNRFGTAITISSTCYYQEIIFWNTDLESSRSAIETDINTYYSVY